MMYRIVACLFLALVICSCSQQSSKKDAHESSVITEVKSGLNIEFGPNLGTSHIDTSGIRHFYVHSTAVITNDSTIPIHIEFALASEYEYPAFCGDTNLYKAFVVPKELTPDTATVYNNVLNGQHDFLNTPLANPVAMNKTLQVGEFCVVTIGILVATPTNCAAVPRAIFSHDNQGLYEACDRRLNPAISTDPQFEIGVKLEYYNQRKFIAPEDGCAVIPFGQISYPAL
jgi:hypothetical protein